MKPDPAQFDFFDEPLFPNRVRIEAIDVDRFRAKLKRAMAQAVGREMRAVARVTTSAMTMLLRLARRRPSSPRMPAQRLAV